jgi:SAM-dependent methyltransferase
MGTGGGEFVAEMSASLPDRVIATEEWGVNVPVAKRRLAKFGIEVIECRSIQLPLKNASFDLVLNRHEDLEPIEVALVLSPGGRVITQQVGRDNWKELRNHFPRMTDFGDLRGKYVTGFKGAGLRLINNLSDDYKVAYKSLGDFVFMLAVTPWTIPQFNLESDIDSLLSLDRECRTENGLELTESRFLLVAEKPKRKD